MATKAEAPTIPRSTFAKLAPHEFLLANLRPSPDNSSPTRADGRAPAATRPVHINAGSLSHAHGSALVRVGDTTVICGVRGEILPVTNIPHYRPLEGDETKTEDEREEEARRELKDYDLLVPNIELATGCAPQFLPGVPPTPLAQTLSTRVYSLLHSSNLLDGTELRIWDHKDEAAKDGQGDTSMDGDDEQEDELTKPELKAYWTLYIDLLFISYDGNPFDAAWISILAALKDTKLPPARWDADREMIICSRKEAKPLTIRGLPVASTTGVLVEREQSRGGKHYVLVDPDRLEESMCDESVTVVLDRSSGETRLRGISKSGGTAVSPKRMGRLVTVAEQRWNEVEDALRGL